MLFKYKIVVYMCSLSHDIFAYSELLFTFHLIVFIKSWRVSCWNSFRK